MTRSQRLRLAEIGAARRMALAAYPVTVSSAPAMRALGDVFDDWAERIDAAGDWLWRHVAWLLRLLLIASMVIAGAGVGGAVWRIMDDAAERAAVSSYVSIPLPIAPVCDYDREHARPVC